MNCVLLGTLEHNSELQFRHMHFSTVQCIAMSSAAVQVSVGPSALSDKVHALSEGGGAYHIFKDRPTTYKASPSKGLR